MTTAAKIVTILIVRFESSEAFVSKSKCIYRNSWTEWVGRETCGLVMRTRSYTYAMCE